MKTKFSFCVLAFLFLGVISSFADAIYFAVNSTPYDRQMSRVQPVLRATGEHHHQPPLGLVNSWIGSLRSIPYGYSTEWQTPSEMQRARAADCKGKAVALYEKMREFGATNVKLVIGRRTPSSRQTHAWLAWETESGSYLLDPTFNYSACRSEKTGGRNYQPLYAFGAHQKFRATSGLIAQN